MKPELVSTCVILVMNTVLYSTSSQTVISRDFSLRKKPQVTNTPRKSIDKCILLATIFIFLFNKLREKKHVGSTIYI